MLPFLLFSAIKYTHAVTIDGDITTSPIDCTSSEDCTVTCSTDCNNKQINCEGYGCAINCVNCQGITVNAIGVSDFSMSCDGNCYQSNIVVELATVNSQFILDCNSADENGGCQQSSVMINHPQSVYESTASSNNNIQINCQGNRACRRLYVSSTINGYFAATCNGEHACARTELIYNPPFQTGTMDLNCTGTNNSACYSMDILSLSTKQINVNCGNGVDQSSPKFSPCYRLSIQGPVLPFDIGVNQYTWDNMNSDSVTFECGNYECQSISIAVPFGINQVTQNNYIYDWDLTSSIYYKCGWDFATSGWNHPQRRLDCDCKDTLENVVLQKLVDGATVDVLNKYSFDLSLSSSYNCPTTGHCIIYSMDSYGGSAEIDTYANNQQATSIACPTDTTSECQIYAALQYGLSLSIIDGTQAKLLLLRGLDSAILTTGVFSRAIINGPTDTVTDGILFLEAGNAGRSFTSATINIQNTAMAIMPQVHDGLIGATIQASEVKWLNIDCDYHSMCDNLRIITNHDAFDKTTGVTTDVVPSNICVACSPFYTASCNGLTIDVTDTSTNTVYILTATQNTTMVNNEQVNEFYWENTNENIKVEMTVAGQGAGAPNTCNGQTETKLGGSWYNGAEVCDNSGGIVDQNAPETCDWFYLWGYSPPLDNYCFAIEGVFSYHQKCVDGTADFNYWTDTTDCIGNAITVVPNGDSGVAASCDSGRICNYATYQWLEFADDSNCNDTVNTGTLVQNAVFTDICFGGMKYVCDDATLTMQTYDNVECTGDASESGFVFEIGECVDDKLVENVECFDESGPSPTKKPTSPPTTGYCDNLGGTSWRPHDKICNLCVCETDDNDDTILEWVCDVIVDSIPDDVKQAFSDACPNLGCDQGKLAVKPADQFSCDCNGFECEVNDTGKGFVLKTFVSIILGFVLYIVGY